MSLTSKPRSSVHHKKRQAGHHRQSRDYIKTYWPYIPISAIIISGLYFNHSLSQHSGVLGAQINFSQTSLLSLTNQDRAKYHLAGLALNSQLEQAAQNKADSMSQKNYWSHIGPSGQTPWSLITGTGYMFQMAGENLAYGFNIPSRVMQAWMNSPEHKANILNNSYQAVGFGISESKNYIGQGPQIIVTAEYAQPLGAVSPANKSQFNLPAATSVSRIQMIGGKWSNWMKLGLSFIVGASLAVLFIRHAIYFKRIIVNSESYVIHHPLIDIFFVLICTVGLTLGHSVGLIG
jgi:uncharacterized protein YkwD